MSPVGMEGVLHGVNHCFGHRAFPEGVARAGEESSGGAAGAWLVVKVVAWGAANSKAEPGLFPTVLYGKLPYLPQKKGHGCNCLSLVCMRCRRLQSVGCKGGMPFCPHGCGRA